MSPRKRGVHDEGTYSVGSRIKRLHGDIITVDAKRFYCADVSLQQYFKSIRTPADSAMLLSRRHVTSAKSCVRLSCVR